MCMNGGYGLDLGVDMFLVDRKVLEFIKGIINLVRVSLRCRVINRPCVCNNNDCNINYGQYGKLNRWVI